MLVETIRDRGKSVAEEPAFYLLTILILFLSGVEVLTLSGSITRISFSRLPATVTILGAFFAASAYYFFFLREDSKREPEEKAKKKGLNWAVVVLVFLVGLFYLWLWVLAYALPDFSWDGLYYHIPTIHFWAKKGYIHWIETGPSTWSLPMKILWNGMPKGVELIGFVLVRATGLPRLLNAVNLPFLPLGVLAIYCLSRFLGASSLWAYLAGALYIFIPINISLAATTYIDSAVASCYIALFTLVLFVLRRLKDGVVPWKFFPALGCGIGLAIGAKGPGIVLLPIVIILLILWILRGASGMHYPKPDLRLADNSTGVKPIYSPSPRIFGKGGVFILITLTVALIVGGYWPTRNYLQTGNPVYPANISAAGITIFKGDQTLFPPPKVLGMEDWSQLKRVIFNWLEVVNNWRGAVTSYSSWYGGLGLLWILGGLPSIIFLLFQIVREYLSERKGRIGKSPDRRESLVVLSAIVLILFFAMPEGHNHIVRYTIWLYGIGLPCFAVVAGLAWSARTPFVRWGGRLWAGVCVIVIILEGLYSLNYQTRRIFAYQSDEGGRTFSFSRIASSLRERYPVGYYWGELKGTIFESILSDKEAVALGDLKGRRKLILGHLSQGEAFGRRNIYFLDQNTIESAYKLKIFLKDHKIKYLIWDIEEPIPTILKDSAVLKEEAGDLFQVLVYIPALLPE